MDGISNLKDEMIFPEELQKYIQSKLNNHELIDEQEKDVVVRLSDLCKVYFKYQEFQRSRSLIDFDDMIVEAVKLLQNKLTLKQKYKQKYKHIFVDEFQDNNYAQLELVKLLSNNGSVTVVGDDDQSIYRFQGAYLTNFQDFLTHFNNATTIILNQNYRSPKNIIKLSNQLLGSLSNRHKKEISSKNEIGEKVVVAKCENEHAEVNFVINTIKSLVGKILIEEMDQTVK